MAIDVASLQLKVNANEAKLAKIELNKLAVAGGRADKSATGMTRSFGLLAPAMLAVAGGGLAINKAFATGKEFGALNAQLQSATGSAEGASEAFAEIQRIATETPFALAEVTKSFVSLVNFGLTPSERAMKAYGDTASAMSKDIQQMIEAVADAATGEFERLKEFGIKAKNQGDTIAFTFRGLTTTVANNAQEIEEFLIRLGETKFAGNMERQMKTLSGLASNLGDSWDKLFLTINQAGVGDAMSEGIRFAIDSVEDLDAFIASGELMAHIDAMGNRFGVIGGDISAVMDDIGAIIARGADAWGIDGTKAVEDIKKAFKELEGSADFLPEKIAAATKKAKLGLEIYREEVKKDAEKPFTIELEPEFLYPKDPTAVFTDIIDKVNSFFLKTALPAIEPIEIEAKAQFQIPDLSPLEATMNIFQTASDERVVAINEETEAGIEAVKAEEEKIKTLSETYAELQAQREKTDLSKFGVGAEALSAEQQALNKYATGVTKVQATYDLLIPKQEILNGLYQDGTISLETYTAETEKLSKASKSASAEMQRAWSDAGRALSQGIGDGVADAIFEVQTFEEAMNATIENIGKKVISTLIDIGIQKAITGIVFGGLSPVVGGAVDAGQTSAFPSASPDFQPGGLSKAGATGGGGQQTGGGNIYMTINVDASGGGDPELYRSAVEQGAKQGYELVASDLRSGGNISRLVG